MKIELDVHTGDETYLGHIRRKLPQALESFHPDIVVYNAGTDVLVGDPLGVLDITPEGVQMRDEIVFQSVRNRNIPIFMVTSGGYQRNNAQVIADSIYNLYEKGLITSPDTSSASLEDNLIDNDDPNE
jgi:histone deacetylase 11